MGNEEKMYEVNFVSLLMFMQGIEAHQGAFYNPQLINCLTTKPFPRGQYQTEVMFTVTYSRPTMDENGYEIGFENWAIDFNLFDRPVLGLHLGLPYKLDPYVINPKDFYIRILSYPGETETYTKPSEDELHEASLHMIETALDNMPKPEFKESYWHLGRYRWRVGMPQTVNLTYNMLEGRCRTNT